jgi:hypothetical protein
MTPEEYEHLVAQVLRDEGWDARVTPHQRDFGVDIIAERAGVRLGVQVKMFGNSNRPVAGTMVMQLYGAAAYADCDTAMIVTDGRILADAGEIAKKLGIEIRVVPASAPSADIPDGLEQHDAKHGGLTFGQVWREHVVPLAGSVLERANGKSNEILRVDDGGVMRRTSTGHTQRIDIEIFRWAIERLLAGEMVSRDEINAQYPGRASSGIALILSAIPLFESSRIDGTQKIRMRVDQSG